MKAPEFNRTLRQLVALPILLLILMAGFLVWQIAAATAAQTALDHSDRVTAQLQELENLFVDQETGLRGFQLTGDPVMLDPWKAAAGPIQIHFGNLRAMLAGDPGQIKAVDDLEVRYNAWLGYANAVLKQDPKVVAAAGMNQRGKAMMDGIRAATSKMLQQEHNTRAQRYRYARWLLGREMISLLVSAVVVGIFLALFTRHHVHAISANYQRRIAEITERSNDLYESQQWFKTTLESIGDAVIACNHRGAVTFMNEVSEKLTGWPLAEAQGKPLAKVFHIINEQTREAAENPVEKVRRLKQVVGLANHTVLVARGGHEYVIDDSAAPIMSGGGRMIGVVLVFRDVTEERRVQRALVASEKLAVAGRLAASIAHEIHNPLDSVANLHFLLDQESDPEKRVEYLRLAQQELGRTMQISRTMLSLYREPKAPIQIDLRELIEGVLLLLDRRIQHLGIRLERKISGELAVEGFPAELRQVFTNLIVNAIEAAGQRGRVRITMQRADPGELNGAGAMIDIADSGPGIPPEVAKKLFQPFFTTKGAEGTGLGLWVSMGIVQKHGGSINIAEDLNRELSGACIRVFLPARTMARQAGQPAA
ncbi:MAG TPA: CHASE3 domain-containing protein [Acidobacteriaceae bacterium]|nr:CHASE3 domain-containing protein [Acidobacteriaceae bacterium]